MFNDESIEDLPEGKNLFPEDDDHMLKDTTVTKEIVLKKLRQFKINKAPGVDEIVPKLLIENASVLSEPIFLIYEESLQ